MKGLIGRKKGKETDELVSTKLNNRYVNNRVRVERVRELRG